MPLKEYGDPPIIAVVSDANEAAILGRIWPIIVNAVDVKPLFPPVGLRPLKEGNWLFPFVANRNAAPAIVIILRVFGIVAALMEARPNRIERVAGHAVAERPLAATAAFGLSAPEGVAQRQKLIAAWAAAAPLRVALLIVRSPP